MSNATQDASHAALVSSAQSFFAELAENNNREWFLAHKARFDTEIAAPAKALSAQIGDLLGQTMGRPYKAKVFRVHRDVRFSKDKSPYKTHLHMSFADLEEAQKQNKFDMQNDFPSFFCGIDPGGMTMKGEDDFEIKAPEFWFMMGYLGFGKARLETYRRFIDVHGDTLSQLLMDGGCQVSSFGADAYKRVPKPYDSDHRHEDLLRRKSLIVGRNVQGAFETGGAPLALIQETLQALKPIADLVAARLIKSESKGGK